MNKENPMGQSAIARALFAKFEKKAAPVASVEDAARKWVAMRGTSGAGVSTIGNGIEVTDGDGKLVARISYNGRIWNPDGSEYAVQIVRGYNAKVQP